MGKLLDTYKQGFKHGVETGKVYKPGELTTDRVSDNLFRKGQEDGRQAYKQAEEKIKPQLEDK